MENRQPVASTSNNHQEANVASSEDGDRNDERSTNSSGLIRTTNAYLPDIVVEGSCSTLKLTLDNVAHNIGSILTSYRYLEQIMPLISTSHDNAVFRNEVYKNLRSTKSVIEDTKGILDQVNLIFDRQDDDQKLNIFDVENNFRNGVALYNNVQKELIRKFRLYRQFETANLDKCNSSGYLNCMNASYGSLQTLHMCQHKVFRNPKLELEKFLYRENILYQTENGICDIEEILDEITTTMDRQRSTIEAIERALAEQARCEAEAAHRAMRNQERRKIFSKILLAVLSMSVAVMLSSGIILLVILY